MLTREESLQKNPRLVELDSHYKPCGPCAFCGFWDKRHRLWDSFIELYDDCISDGESHEKAIKSICQLFPNESPEHIAKAIEIRPYVAKME